MKVIIEGCAHGELETIYETISCLETRDIKIDLLICCGDFQSSRNEEDLRCMAVPPKYYNMCSFYKYYSGEKIAPVLTIFIGGNHEASNYLQELPYGGWVAPNIYYMGYAGIINIGGIKIGGISGIYKDRDYMKGRYEVAPYDESSKRSVYHVRNLDVFRLKQLSQPVDIFFSHDWPMGICNYGNKEQLIKFKPYFREDIDTGKLGSKPAEQLLHELKPTYWFAAHLHCKFSAVVPHSDRKMTKFLALDKCLPRRRYFQLLDIPHDPEQSLDLKYDVEWLTILKLTNHLTSVKNVTNYMPSELGKERYNFTPTEEEMNLLQQHLPNDLRIPKNFQMTATSYAPNTTSQIIRQPRAVSNPQTVTFCDMVGVDDPLTLLGNLNGFVPSETLNQSAGDNVDNTTFINDTDLEVSAELTGDSPWKRSSLSLPAPKGNLHDSFASDDHDKPDHEELKGNVSGTESSAAVGNSLSESADEDRMDEDAGSCLLKKKFKRRNADLYKSDE